MTADSVDVGQLLADLAYATEALATIRARALESLPYTASSRAFHDPILDIINAAERGLRLPKEETCSTTTP